MPGTSKKSDGLRGAASIETRTSSWPRTGSETVLSSMTSEGSPKATSCNCRITKRLSFASVFPVSANTMMTPTCIQMRSSHGLHLCEAAIHEQFRSRDVAAVVGGEKYHGLRDLIGPTDAAERDPVAIELVQALAVRFHEAAKPRRAVLVGELVMRDLLSSFGAASPRDRAVFAAPAFSRPFPADQHELVETACNLVDGCHAVTPLSWCWLMAVLQSMPPRWEREGGCMPGIIPSP